MKIKNIVFALVLALSIMASFTVSAEYIKDLGMNLEIPADYSNLETGLEKGEYAYFVSNSANQYISVKVTKDEATKAIESFDGYADSELVQIASKISNETKNANVTVHKTPNYRFIKVKNDDKIIYYTVINGSCVSIAAVKTGGEGPKDIINTINSIKFNKLSRIGNSRLDEIYHPPIWLLIAIAIIAVGAIAGFNIWWEKREREMAEYYDDERF